MDVARQARAGSRAGQVLRVAGVVAAAVAVVLAGAAGAVYLWLRTYTPLGVLTTDFSPGAGVTAAIQPAVGSGGKEVFFPAYRGGKPFDASFTLHNTGHFAVTVQGIVPAQQGTPPWIGAVRLLGANLGHTGPFEPFRLSAGDTAVVVVRFQPACPKGAVRTESVYADSVQFRYHYLRIFDRTQTVRLPFAVTLRCIGAPPANP